MKKFIYLLSLSLALVISTAVSFGASAVSVEPPAEKLETVSFAGLKNMTVDEFLALTPKKIRQQTGKKLSLKEVFILKKVQKKVKNAAKGNAGGGKDQVVALILVLLVGVLGIHRFYLGYTGIGIIQLLTFGMCGIWTLIDMIRIITGDLQPKDGPYEETL